MKKILFGIACVVSAVVLAQRVDDFRSSPVQLYNTHYEALPDGGALISGCARVVSDAGIGVRPGVLDFCSQPIAGRTPAQRNALAQCLDNGEKAWALEAKIRADAGF